MTIDSIKSLFVDGHTHRITNKTSVVAGNPTTRLTLACGLSMDCMPEWVHTPPVQIDELGSPVPWTISFSEEAAADCPGCVGA